jgi:hypothetical protein
MTSCLNLCERFGARYKIAWDPADESGHQDPRVMTIPCARGTIFPHGGDTLAVEVDGHPKLAGLLRGLGFVCHQDGDDMQTFLFPVERFDEVAKLIRPYRRPAPETADRLKAFRFGTPGEGVSAAPSGPEASEVGQRPPRATSPVQDVPKPGL